MDGAFPIICNFISSKFWGTLFATFSAIVTEIIRFFGEYELLHTKRENFYLQVRYGPKGNLLVLFLFI